MLDCKSSHCCISFFSLTRFCFISFPHLNVLRQSVTPSGFIYSCGKHNRSSKMAGSEAQVGGKKKKTRKKTKTKQGQNERQESTVAARTMAANYSRQSAAEQAAGFEKSLS